MKRRRRDSNLEPLTWSDEPPDQQNNKHLLIYQFKKIQINLWKVPAFFFFEELIKNEIKIESIN